jgi:hypothetical protein
VKEDGADEPRFVAEAARLILEPLDLAVHRFARGVGYRYPQVGQASVLWNPVLQNDFIVDGRGGKPRTPNPIGRVAAYLSYILVFVIVLLVLYPSIRHW